MYAWLCYYTDKIANYLYNANSFSFLQIINQKWNFATKHVKPSNHSTINVTTVKLSKAIRHCLQVNFSEDHREWTSLQLPLWNGFCLNLAQWSWVLVHNIPSHLINNTCQQNIVWLHLQLEVWTTPPWLHFCVYGPVFHTEFSILHQQWTDIPKIIKWFHVSTCTCTLYIDSFSC